MTETPAETLGENYVDVQPRRVRRRKTDYTVRLLTESGADPVQFSHEDKGVARHYVETHHPRGREVYVEYPDGYREHFSADHKFQGHSDGGWFPLEDEEE